MCIYTVSNSVEPLDVFEFTRSAGGRSCYRGGRRTVFAPTSGSACEPNVPAFLNVEQVTTAEDGERQFLACTVRLVFESVDNNDNTVLIARTPNLNDEASEREYYLQTVDLLALATNGALVALSFQSLTIRNGYSIACFDTDQPDLLKHQIDISVEPLEGMDFVSKKSSCTAEIESARREVP